MGCALRVSRVTASSPGAKFGHGQLTQDVKPIAVRVQMEKDFSLTPLRSPTIAEIYSSIRKDIVSLTHHPALYALLFLSF